MAEEHTRVRLIVSGTVQGVLYRVSAKQEADRLHLAGWVKNTKDGFVEILVGGDTKAVEQFVSWARQGPPLAEVDSVRVEEEADQGELSGFEIRPTDA